MMENNRTELLLKERDLALKNANIHIKRGKFKSAAKFYSIASDASIELGEKKASEEYKAKTQNIIDNLKELKLAFKQQKRNS